MKKESLEIAKIIVNPKNYRFDPVDTQDEAIDLMLIEKGKEIFNLAQHILEYGLDVAKSLRVLIQDNNYLLLDGNRRITAIKCLHDTTLIRDPLLKKKFDNLLKDFSGKLIQSVDSIVYDNEKEAARWIKIDHTGKNKGVGQDPWAAAGIDRFEQKFEGKTSPSIQLISFLEEKLGRKQIGRASCRERV